MSDKRNLEYRVDVKVDPNGIISMTTNELIGSAAKMVIDTNEAAVREGLIRLGWTPPKGDQQGPRIALENTLGEVVSDWHPAAREGFLSQFSIEGIKNITKHDQLVSAIVCSDGSRYELGHPVFMPPGTEAKFKGGVKAGQ